MPKRLRPDEPSCSAESTRPFKHHKHLQSTTVGFERTVETSVLQSPVAAPPARLSIFGSSTYDTYRPSQPKAVDSELDLFDALMLLD